MDDESDKPKKKRERGHNAKQRLSTLVPPRVASDPVLDAVLGHSPSCDGHLVVDESAADLGVDSSGVRLKLFGGSNSASNRSTLVNLGLHSVGARHGSILGNIVELRILNLGAASCGMCEGKGGERLKVNIALLFSLISWNQATCSTSAENWSRFRRRGVEKYGEITRAERGGVRCASVAHGEIVTCKVLCLVGLKRKTGKKQQKQQHRQQQQAKGIEKGTTGWLSIPLH